MRCKFAPVLCGLFSLMAVMPLSAKRLELVWPTPNTAFLEERPIETFIQPTVSGEASSGLFGCVRNHGRQFHEGLDLAPLKRDQRGEPADPVFAAMSGIVRYINHTPGNSSYGRYIVLEHPAARPSVYTLYAHLAAIAAGLGENQPVTLGQIIGQMGRSAGGYRIPKERAHLHFEIGLRLTDRFQEWYDWKKFGSANHHDGWNGMNLVGLDPLDFYTRFKEKSVDNFSDYLRTRPAAVVIRIKYLGIPDFVRRYPELKAETNALFIAPAGWEVSVDCVGFPFHWRPLHGEELTGYRQGEVNIISVDETIQAQCRCKRLVSKRSRGYVPDRDLQSLTQLLFGLRSK